MKPWVNIFRVIILIIGLTAVAFDAELYIVCKQQGAALNAMKDKLDTESEFNSNKFKYQQEQIERLSKDLDDDRQQIKSQNDTLADQKSALAEQKDALANQKDALLQEAEKRQQVENDSKYIQTSLVDIKAEADAIKQDMKGWQKDYVSVLAQLEKKMESSQYEIKSLESNLTALNIPELKANINSLKTDIEKIIHPPDNSLPSIPPPEPEKKIEREEFKSQY